MRKSLSNRKTRAIIALIVVIIIHLALDLLYRPLAYERFWNDFGLKDSFTQITSVIGISLLMVIFEKEEAWNGKTGKIFLVVVPVIAMIIYEFLQIYITASRFDKQDLIFTLIGGVFVAVVQHKINGASRQIIF